MRYLPAILHAAMALALLAAYVTLSALGQDANVLAGALAGQLGGIGIEGISKAANGINGVHK